MLDQCGLLVLIKMSSVHFLSSLSLYFFVFFLVGFFVVTLKEEGRVQLGSPNHSKYT